MYWLGASSNFDAFMKFVVQKLGQIALLGSPYENLNLVSGCLGKIKLPITLLIWMFNG